MRKGTYLPFYTPSNERIQYGGGWPVKKQYVNSKSAKNLPKSPGLMNHNFIGAKLKKKKKIGGTGRCSPKNGIIGI